MSGPMVSPAETGGPPALGGTAAAPSRPGGAAGARSALAFLTPVGGAAAPSPAALGWFPVVGAALGLALGGTWHLAARAWPPGVAAAVVVAADLGITGLLHLDGLVDAADGLLPPLDRARRLEVMADPATGAFGVGAAAAVVLLRWSALAAVRPSALLLGGLWCASRTAMAVAARTVPYARPTGLASGFLAGEAGGPRAAGAGLLAAAGLAGALALAGAGRGAAGAGAVGAAVVGAAAVVALARRRVGGFTGDVLGSAGLVGETAGLVVAAIRW
ncbi:MAG: adenosylcobinamide-GDP ribazoletransferase [Acidimicrobiales bacterium]